MILDTTVLISAERTRSRLDAVMADDDDAAIAAVTVAELLAGVELATSRHRARRATFVEGVLGTLTVEDYTADTARSHAALLVAARRDGRPRGAHDLIIAATAVSTARILVTADDRGFDGLPGLETRVIR
ncbi:MAG: PIN domain-containing protein [Microbacterium sp.]